MSELSDEQFKNLKIYENGLLTALRTMDAYERCNESLRAERDALVAELTIAKQETANTLHELGSAVEVIEHCLRLDYSPRLNFARDWLTLHSQQTKAPLMVPDPEAEAEEAKEQMLEEDR